MSLIITVYTQQGLVMAADSRLTLNFARRPGDPSQMVSTPTSDSATKLFLLGSVGVSFYGVADINRSPIAGAIEKFTVEHNITERNLDPEATANDLLSYFSKHGVSQGTEFHVGGYRAGTASVEQELWSVNLGTKICQRLNKPHEQGATWGGEIDVLQRLLNDVQLVPSGGALPQPIPFFGTPFEWFTLQDAIDFAQYAIHTSIETMRFQYREKTVGGPVDVLVITPSGAQWIARKSLYVQQ